MAKLVMSKLTFCHKLSIASPSYHVKQMKKEVANFPHVKLLSASNEKLYFMHAKKLQIFNLRMEKKCSAGNFVTSAKVSWENHFKIFQTII